MNIVFTWMASGNGRERTVTIVMLKQCSSKETVRVVKVVEDVQKCERSSVTRKRNNNNEIESNDRKRKEM